MSFFRIAMHYAVLLLFGLSAAAAQRAGAKPKLNETKIEDLDELEPPFKAWTGIDYGPFQRPPPRIKIVNITGIFVESPLECAIRCTDLKLCNAASYYGENPVGSWPSGLTCWLKTISVPCKLPADYEVTEFPGTIFLLAQEEECEEEEGPSLLANLTADAAGPGEGPLMAARDYDPLMAPLEDYPVMAPMEIEEPLMSPVERPLEAVAPLPDAPATAPPPVAPAVRSGGLITDFQVGTQPVPAVAGSPAPPATPSTPSVRETGEAPAPGPEDDADNFPEAFSPQAVFGLNLAASSSVQHAAFAVAAMAAMLGLLAL